MKTFIKKSAFIASVILATSSCISCDSNEAKNEIPTLIVAENTTKTLAITNRKPIVFITGFDKGTEKYYSNARSYFQEKELK